MAASVTRQIKSNKRLIIFIKEILPLLKKTSSLSDISNNYPRFIELRKLWPLMGTFTDYMIRKMLAERYNLEIGHLICEHSGVNLKSLVFDKVEKGDSEFIEELLDDIDELMEYPSEDINDDSGICSPYTMGYDGYEYRKKHDTFYRRPIRGMYRSDISQRTRFSYLELDTWVENYKNKKKSWVDVIEDTFYMAQTDSLFRSGVLADRILFPSEYLAEFQTYFQNIMEYIPLLNFTPPILLNPTLSAKSCPADADIIDADCIYDIKTSKYTPKKEDLMQLIVYLALYLKRDNQRLSNIAIFNPVYLGIERYNCELITEEHLNKIFECVTNPVMDQPDKNPINIQRPNVGSPKKSNNKDDFVELIRKLKY